MAASYTFTGQCYSQSGNVKKYEENQFTHFLNPLPSTCPFTYISEASYNPVNSYDFAYYNYSGGITNTTTGDYEYTFTAYAYTKWVNPNSFMTTYSYAAVINGIQQENNFANHSITDYSYSSMGSYTTQFQTNYGGVQKYCYLTLEIVAYWHAASATAKTTYYTGKITFMYNRNDEQTFSLGGVYLFSIQNPGTFVGTESAWNSLGLVSLATFYDQISTTSGTTGTAIGYVSCIGTSLNTASLTVYTESLTTATSTISRESMIVGTSTIYVIGVRKILDSSVGSSKTYRYTTSLLSTLTASSWSTTKPSVSGLTPSA